MLGQWAGVRAEAWPLTGSLDCPEQHAPPAEWAEAPLAPGPGGGAVPGAGPHKERPVPTESLIFSPQGTNLRSILFL